MRNRVFSAWPCLLLLLVVPPASAQYWEDAGQPANAAAAYVCYNDTVHDWLLVAPALAVINHTYHPLFRYDGHSWSTLGLFGNVVYTAVVYRDTLIVGGGFDWMHEDSIKHIACYVDGTWHPYGDFWGGASHVRSLRVVDGELYALGVFQYADGQWCNGAAKRVGGHWEPLPDWPTFQGEPWIFDIIRFQGKLVVGGNFRTQDPVIRDMIQYDGTAWVPVCEGCMNGGMDGAAKFITYQDDLYMGGRFYYGSGNPGQGVMRWDGEQWYGLSTEAGGLQTINHSDQYPAGVGMFEVWEGRLFMGGEFKFANHLPTPGIASWDGTSYCTLGGAEVLTDNGVTSFTFYHDTLYLAGGFTMGRGLLRYLSTDFTHECSTLGVEELAGPGTALQVHWSENAGLILLGLPDGLHDAQVFDAQGRLVLRQPVRSQAGRSEAIPFNPPGSALYLAVVDGQQVGRFMIIR